MIDGAEKAKLYHKAIHEILLKEWDPIGVSHIPEAHDEHDSYVGEVYRLLIVRASERQVFDYLWEVETKYMGLFGNRRKTSGIARRLHKLTEEIG